MLQLQKFLAAYHNLRITLRTLKKRLCKSELTRRNNTNPEAMQEIMAILSHEMEGPAPHAKYRYS